MSHDSVAVVCEDHKRMTMREIAMAYENIDNPMYSDDWDEGLYEEFQSVVDVDVVKDAFEGVEESDFVDSVEDIVTRAEAEWTPEDFEFAAKCVSLMKELEDTEEYDEYRFGADDVVEWDASGGPVYGVVVDRTREGCYNDEIKGDNEICGSYDEPAYRIRVYDDEEEEFTGEFVAHRESELRFTNEEIEEEFADRVEFEFEEGDAVTWALPHGEAYGVVIEGTRKKCYDRPVQGEQLVCGASSNPAYIVERYDMEAGELTGDVEAHTQDELISADFEADVDDSTTRQSYGYVPDENRHLQEVDTVPPDTVAEEAQTALDARDNDEFDNDECGTDTGWERANQLVNKESLSEDTINRMVSFFARHDGNQEVNEGVEHREEDCGWLMWKAWGGDAGKEWAERKQEEFEQDEEEENSEEFEAGDAEHEKYKTELLEEIHEYVEALFAMEGEDLSELSSEELASKVRGITPKGPDFVPIMPVQDDVRDEEIENAPYDDMDSCMDYHVDKEGYPRDQAYAMCKRKLGGESVENDDVERTERSPMSGEYWRDEVYPYLKIDETGEAWDDLLDYVTKSYNSIHYTFESVEQHHNEMFNDREPMTGEVEVWVPDDVDEFMSFEEYVDAVEDLEIDEPSARMVANDLMRNVHFALHMLTYFVDHYKGSHSDSDDGDAGSDDSESSDRDSEDESAGVESDVETSEGDEELSEKGEWETMQLVPSSVQKVETSDEDVELSAEKVDGDFVDEAFTDE